MGRRAQATDGTGPKAQCRDPVRIDRVGLHEEARARLRRMIVRGQLLPGGSLGEVGLSHSLGISRTPLREALKLLSTEGLVELRANRGAFVMPMEASGIADLFEVASGLERLAGELAALRHTDVDLDRLRRLQAELEVHHDDGDRERYFETNQQIHRAIVRMSGNEVLRTTHELLFARVERVRFFALGAHGRWGESVREHRDILSALAARDAARAGDALARHVRRTGTQAQRLLEEADIARSATPRTRLQQDRTQGEGGRP